MCPYRAESSFDPIHHPHMAEQCRLDLRWLRAVLADVEAGPICDTPDPVRLAAKT